MAPPRQCPQCGAELTHDAPAGLCPACLMKAGLGGPIHADNGTDLPTVSGPHHRSDSDETVSSPPGPSQMHRDAVPEVGRQFGAYRLVRLLGRGGMGAVYEAEHLESGRRVALKVLSHSLDSPEAQARFLREGRLAASINHPNSVYIYGTEEVQGTPAIVMELVAGGTLEERVRQKGPMPVAKAVDAILQIIEGLEAAEAVGVLHRDIKPSNCFLESDGTVKVGDFGLSISTKVRRETNLTITGTFLGTPAFSSPEQLKGDELDVRSDIYAVGVTLYYLLTGKTPFRADNLVRFVATVLERPAESPATLRREIPKGLCQAVLRCLEKQPAQRFRNYSELRHALLPFASAAPTPATMGLRFLAVALDMVAWFGVWMPVSFCLMGDTASLRNPAGSLAFFGPMLAGLAPWILYYAIAEGVWGASLGKAVCRLRVVGPGRSVPGVPRALLRAVLFTVLPALPIWVCFGFDPQRLVTIAPRPFSLDMVDAYSYYVLLALMFATARRRNGFAGLHELASGTRVIRRAAYEARPALQPESPAQPVSEATPAIGPYHVLENLGKTGAEELVLGYDTRLLRKVWVRRMPAGSPPVAAGIRDLGRVGRLRWLGGRRTQNENWDAYEAPSGKPLLALLGERQPWRAVRYWLLDLAEELQAGLKDGSVPTALGLDQVWITADGRAKLLDFPAPGIGPRSAASPSPAPTATDFQAARLLLNQVAIAALEGRVIEADAARDRTVAVPVPLHARTFLEGLPTLQDFGPLIGGLKPLLRKVASVSRLRRFAIVAGCAFLAILVGGGLIVASFMMPHANWLVCHDRGGRWIFSMRPPGNWLEFRDWCMSPEPSEKEPADATSVAQPRVGKMSTLGMPFSPLITGFVSIAWGELARAQPILTSHGTATITPGPGYKAPSGCDLGLKAGEDMETVSTFLWLPSPTFGWLVSGEVVAFLSLACALLFRGGLVLRLLGVTIVKRDGSRASRLRVFWRSLATWLPLLALSLLFWLGSDVPLAWPGYWTGAFELDDISIRVLALFIPLVIGSTLLRDRGLQDRMAGTWLVPR